MAGANSTYIVYHIPCDGDNEENPNIFLLKKPAKAVTLADVRENFPIPGSYFFRAKQVYGKTHSESGD